MITTFTVFDIESIPNPDFIGYTREEQEEWFADQWKEGDVPGARAWVPTWQQLPWVTGCLTWTGEEFREGILSGDDCVEILRNETCRWGTLVGYNIHGFDFPLIEATALRTGKTCPWWFGGAKSWEKPRHKFNDFFWDCQLVATNFNAVQRRDTKGGLNTLCNLVGAPGKLDVTGDDVWELYWAGKRDKAIGYVHHDDYNCLLVFLRQAMVAGKLHMSAYDHIIAKFEQFLENKQMDLFDDNEFTHRQEFLKAWRSVKNSKVS